MNLLLLVLALPAAGFLIALALPRSSPASSRNWALGISLVTFLASLALLGWFDRTLAGDQLTVDWLWIPSPEIHFHIAADGVSLWLVLLTTFLTPICVLISWNSIQSRVKEFYAFLLLLEFGLVGVFLAQDLFLFYVFWEVSPGADVLPDRHLGPRAAHLRRGEVLPLHHGRFGADAGGHHLPLQPRRHLQLRRHPATSSPAAAWSSPSVEQMLLFLAFFVAFAIKVPLFPLHTWLPDAHVEAPVGRFRDAGLRHAEDGHLRNPALLPAAVSQRRARAAPRGSRCWPSSASSTARWWPWCSPT